MHLETIYLMTENGRFVCTDGYGDVTIKKDHADATCKYQAGWGPFGEKVVIYNPASDRGWAVAPDPATPHVDGLITARKSDWTTFDYRIDEKDPTLMTLSTEDGQYVSRVDIGRPHEYIAADGSSADGASRFRVIRFANDAA